MKSTEFDERVKIALLGEIPPTLRFLYAYLENNIFYFNAVFIDDAENEHLECARTAATEIEAGLPKDIEFKELIEKDSKKPWKVNDGKGLFYLRYGELSGYD